MVRFHPKGFAVLLLVVGLVALATRAGIGLIAPLVAIAALTVDWSSLIVPFIPAARDQRPN